MRVVDGEIGKTVAPEQHPTVTFVVPCYNLGHLLRECVESILAQTYEDFEVLIMDDCSPDDTPAVARSFTDPRVRHIRNDPNLGHLKNYDAGIRLARGRYLWLISADDKLRRPYVLERFVVALDSNPGASFVFCPAMKFNEHGETEVYGAHGDEARVFPPAAFLRTLASGNSVSAPAAMARTAFYTRMGGFPLDLPFAGDWYVWARLALEAPVVYLPEPMVNYRVHADNMTKGFLGPKAAALVRDELEVRWRLRRDAETLAHAEAIGWIESALVADYAYRASCLAASDSPYGLTIPVIEESLLTHSAAPDLARRVRAAAWTAAGDAHQDNGRQADARRCYAQALRVRPRPAISIKYILAAAGMPGDHTRRLIANARGRWHGA
jgi:glycosyltransferase involved in cell wall biosynthesis